MEIEGLNRKSIFSYLALSVLFCLASCSDKGEDLLNDSLSGKDPSLKLLYSQQEIEPFGIINLEIDNDQETLIEAYDSIRWIANGITNTHFIVSFEYLDFRMRISLTDYLVGEHKAYVLGYKDGKVISKDSMEYRVNMPNKDFLNIRWKQQNRNQYFECVSGLTPYRYVFYDGREDRLQGLDLNLNHCVEGVKEYASMSFLPWTATLLRSVRAAKLADIVEFDWLNDSVEGSIARGKFECAFFHDYFTDLYGEPKFIYTGDDPKETTLQEECDKRFSCEIDSGYYPVEIWETPTTYICITQGASWLGPYGGQRGSCIVFAQPRR